MGSVIGNKGNQRSALLAGIEDDLNENTVRTENGAKTLKSTKDSVLDLFSRGAAYRTRQPSEAGGKCRDARCPSSAHAPKRGP